jgi:integrase
MRQKRKIELNIKGFKAWLSKQGLAESTIKKYLIYIKLMPYVTGASINKALNKGFTAYYALKWYARFDKRALKYLPSKPPRQPKPALRYPLTESEAYKILEYCKTAKYELYVFLLLLFHTGCRGGTIINLRLIDFEARGAELAPGEDYTTFSIKTKGGERIVKPISKEVYDEVRHYARNKNIKDKIFNRPCQRTYGRWLHKICKGLLFERYQGYPVQKVTLHHFRHLFCLRVYEETHDPLLCKLALNHKSFNSTERYLIGKADRSGEVSLKLMRKSFPGHK